MKKKTLNQQLGFTPVVKEEVFTFTEEQYISIQSSHYNPYTKSEAAPPPYYLLPRNPLKSKEKNPILKLLLAISIGAIVGFSIICLSK